MVEFSTRFSGRLVGAGAVALGIFFYMGVDNDLGNLSAQVGSKATGVINVRDVGRGTALVLLSDTGKVLAACHELKCGYANYRQDIGKAGVFHSIQEQVVRIEVDGQIRLEEERLQHAIERKKLIAILVGIAGIAILAGSIFL